MGTTVSAMSIVIITIGLVLGLATPVILLVVFRKKYKCNIGAFFVGCGVMILLAFVLEKILHMIVLASPIGNAIQTNIWLYGIYGGFAAALFEETGRFMAFRFVLKKKQNNDYNALMYGAGHGGIEMIVVMSVVMLNNLIYAVMINSGTMDQTIAMLPSAQQDAMNSVVTQLINASPLLFLVSPIERIAALVLQLSLSVLVWFAVKEKKNIVLFPIAMGLHMLVDGVLGVTSKAGISMVVIELIMYALTAVIAYIAIRVWKK